MKTSKFYLAILYLIVGHLAVFPQKINNTLIESFQRNLINEKHAGSNVILINKENQIILE